MAMLTGLFQSSSPVCQTRRHYVAERGPAIPSEKAFSDLWERSLEVRPELIGRDGEVYEILFPGVRNQGAGPDFKGAVLRRDGRTVGGDVELHLDSSGWRAHGHQGDARYSGVVLQVVLKARFGGDSAKMPPTAEARFEFAQDRAPRESCPGEVPDLEGLGFRRFLSKSAGFRLEFETVSDPDQVIYSSVLDAMGYARNRKPFRLLARQVPYDLFRGLSGEPQSTADFAVFSALVVGGGLTADLERSELSQVRRIARAMGGTARVGPREWSRFRIRPSNTPVSRIRGISPLVAASAKFGLVNSLEAVFERDGVPGLIREVENRPYIGRGLAVTVAANVIVPALHAIAIGRGIGEPERFEEAFREMPAPPQDAVTRGVSTVLGLDVRPRLATQHFGLHALARSKSWPGVPRSAA